jgi:TolB protein
MRRFRFFLILLLFAVGCSGRGGQPTILYLRPGPAGTAQLFRQTLGGEALQLTGVVDPVAWEVIDFAAAPDGNRIVYAVQDGLDSALRIVDAGGGNDAALLACPVAECAGIAWSPDGRRLIYERRPWENGSFGSPRLHWLDTDTGETLPLVAGNETPGYGACFSLDGAWLSYVSPAEEGVVLYRPADGAQRLLTSRVGSPAAWSPDGAMVVVGDIVPEAHETRPEGGSAAPVEESSNVYLYRTLVAGDAPRERLSPEASVADSAPAFSPDGEWIAFGRAPGGNTAAGRQLWLMRADGSEARALTADPALTHGPPSWSPDGQYLLYQRYRLDDPASSASVWVMEVAIGEETLVAEGGFLPRWLP